MTTTDKSRPRAEWPEPAQPAPSYDQLNRWMHDGVACATDGCLVELDGVCPHGHPSWTLYLGYVR